MSQTILEGVKFTLEDAKRASDEWCFNCGPGALCAVLGMTPDALRPHMLDFEAKGYTNPTLLFNVLRGLKVRHRLIYRGDVANPRVPYPRLGLVRVQWAGPWTKPGVPMAARYRQTHWAAVRRGPDGQEAFDINAMCVGGWLSWAEWSGQLIPWLIRECAPRATGEWWPTHVIEVEDA